MDYATALKQIAQEQNVKLPPVKGVTTSQKKKTIVMQMDTPAQYHREDLRAVVEFQEKLLKEIEETSNKKDRGMQRYIKECKENLKERRKIMENTPE